MSRLVSSALLALTLASCGGTSPAPAPTPRANALPGPPRPWNELSHDERAGHMAREVVPRMTDLFVGYDRARYDEFGCPTCHGPDARERNYAMPNPSLLPLHPTGSEGQHQTVRDYPEGVRFMYNQVLPAMQALLAAPDYDASTHQGFSCYSCHPHAEDVPSTNVTASAD